MALTSILAKPAITTQCHQDSLSVDALYDPARINAVRQSRLAIEDLRSWLDRIVRLAAAACHSPMSLALLLDDRAIDVVAVFGSLSLLPLAHGTSRVPIPRTIAARVVIDDETLEIPDIRRDHQHRLDPFTDMGIASVLAVPLRRHGRSVGALVVADSHPRGWSGEAVESVETLAALTENRLRASQGESRPIETSLVSSNTVDAVIEIDHDGRIAALNSHASALLDLPVQRAIGMPFSTTSTDGILSSDVAEALWSTLNENRDGLVEWARHERGDWIEVRSFPSERGATIILRDVTDRKRREARLQFEAYHDPLTQLPNRRLLHDRIQQALARGRRYSHPVALLFLDLDDFKRVNDLLGHDAGDQLLVEVARRLRSVLREEDTAARLGGDEFVVLLPQVTEQSGAREVAQRIIDRLRKPVRIGDERIVPATSIGVALTAGMDDSPDELLRRADAAMYRAKAAGKNQYALDLAQPSTHRSLTSLIREHDPASLILYVQPQINPQNRSIAALEALVRWRHPRRGLLAPETFLPRAEHYGLAAEIDRWTLRAATRASHCWPKTASAQSPNVAVNLSLSSIHDPSIPRAVSRILDDERIDPSRVEFEIPALHLHNPDSRVLHAMRELAGIGCRIVADDVRTVGDAERLMRSLPIAAIKLNQAGRAALSHGIDHLIQIASGAGFETILFGLESAEDVDRARLLRASRVQGFAVGRPVPADTLALLFRPDV